jgi:5-methylcytosine-specific restriction endonuclease McrA
MHSVLVLNASFEPINIVSLKRAVVLVLKEKAEIIEARVERQLQAANAVVPYPLVIRLVTYVHIPRRATVPLTRRTLLSRDNFTCQYCGSTETPLTIDHIVPRSRGGKTEWTNCVAACASCNRRKADKLPAEAKMHPLNPPVKPGYLAVVLLGRAYGGNHEVWQRYIGA